MDGYRDLRLILRALRDRLVEPDLLARVGADWSPDEHPPFLEYLAGRNVLDPEKVRRLEEDEAAASTRYITRPLPAIELGAGTATAPGRPPAEPAGTTASTLTGDGSDGTPDWSGDARAAAPAAVPDLPGGRYRVLRLHRPGGLGVVWLAEDAAVGREVAVKTIRPEYAWDPRARVRFLREARVTGRLEHPCVVPLYDLAPADGRTGPAFYAMRFVAGRTLAEAVTAYHAGPPDRLGLAALLDAFVAVCRAVAFAHSRGVLHRDLKGQNVALGDFGEVFLLDWGLAKEITGPQAGGAGQPLDGPDPDTGDGGTVPRAVIGTPGFMSPQVAAGEPATVASDVYGLGAVLYAILTGHPPYHTGTPRERVEQTLAADPPPPRAVKPVVPAPLDAVCRRAMARDPAARYPSADALATEVRRYLADEPVEAYREPWPARAARWGRRHRTAVTTAAAVLVALTVALAVGSVAVWRERERTEEQRLAAVAAYGRADAEQKRAFENFVTARTALRDISERITAIETGVNNPRLADTARKAALDQAREAFERFRTAQPDDTEIQMQTAVLHRYAGNVARLLSDPSRRTDTEATYTASIRIWEELIREDPANAGHRDNLAQTLGDLAMFYKLSGRLREATKTLDRAATIADGIRDQVRDAHYRRTLGLILLDRASVEYLSGRFEPMEKSAREALALFDGLRQATASDAKPLDPLLAAIAAHDVAKACRGQGRIAAAATAHADAAGRLRALTQGTMAADRNVRHWAGEVAREQARTLAEILPRRDEAVTALNGVLPAAEQLTGEYPGVPMYKAALAEAFFVRGQVQAAAGRSWPAEQDFNKSLALTRQLIDTHKPQSAFLKIRGETYLELARLNTGKDKSKAKEYLGAAAKVFEIALKSDPDNFHHARGADLVRRLGAEVAR